MNEELKKRLLELDAKVAQKIGVASSPAPVAKQTTSTSSSASQDLAELRTRMGQSSATIQPAVAQGDPYSKIKEVGTYYKDLYKEVPKEPHYSSLTEKGIMEAPAILGGTIAGEAKKSLNRMATSGNPFQGVIELGKLAKTVAQGLGTVGITAGQEVVEQAVKLNPFIADKADAIQFVRDAFENPVNKFITGDHVFSYSEVKPKIQEFINKDPDATPWEKLHLAPILVAGMAFTDWMPGGRAATTGSAKVFEAISTLEKKSLETVSEILIKNQVPKDVADVIAPRVAKATNVEEVDTIIKSGVIEHLSKVNEESGLAQAIAKREEGLISPKTYDDYVAMSKDRPEVMSKADKEMLETLTEARKYDTPDSYLDSFAQKLYRGGDPDGNHFTTSKIVADDYATNRGGTVSAFVLNPKAKTISYDEIPNVKYKGINDDTIGRFVIPTGKTKKDFMEGELEQDYSKAAEWAKENGYDIVTFSTEGEFRKLTPNAILYKEQVVDIWNKAHDKTPEETEYLKQITKDIEEGITRKRFDTAQDARRREQALARGKVEGEKVGRKEAEAKAVKEKESAVAKEKIIGEAKLEKAVRKEELKALKGGIKMRAAKDKIIDGLRRAEVESSLVRKDIVALTKEFLPSSEQGKLLTLLRDAKTKKDLSRAAARVFRVAEEVEKRDLRDEIISLKNKIIDSPSVSVDYKQKVRDLLKGIELKGHREDTIKRLEETQKFLNSEAAKGNDVEMPREILKALELLKRTPLMELSTSQLTGLKAELELIEELGRTKFKTFESRWEAKKEAILTAVKVQDAPPITENELIKPAIGERLTATQKLKNTVWLTANRLAKIDRAILPMDTVFDLLDGGKGTYNGANYKFFKARVDADYGKFITLKDTIQEPVIELAKKYKLDDKNFERIGVVAAREQEGGMEKLMAHGFTEKEINEVKLSKYEQEMLDSMRGVFSSQLPAVREVMRKIYNQEVGEVKNYFSFMTDFKAMSDSEVFERMGPNVKEISGVLKKNTEKGFTESRVGGAQKIKLNAMEIFLNHTENTSYLIEMGPTAKMLGEVANSPSYRESVGEAGQLMVREWVDTIARKGGIAGSQQIALLDTLRRNVSAGILGLKLSTIAIQPTALIDGMGFIGADYGMRGVTGFTTDSALRKYILSMPEISDRMGGEYALREMTDDNWLQEIQRKGFIPMQKMDQITAGSIATGAYIRKMTELGEVIDVTKPYNKEALEYAQLAVRRTQSSGSFKDVPLAISRGALTGNRSLDRAIFQFQNFILTSWSRIRHDAIRASINTKDPRKALPVFATILLASAAASGIRLGVNKTQDFITGKEDEDTIREDLEKSFWFEMMGRVPFLGTMMSMAIYDGEMFPILDAPKGVITGLDTAITAKSESAKLRGLTEFTSSVGQIMGVPGSAQASQLVKGTLSEPTSQQQASKTIKELNKLPREEAAKRYDQIKEENPSLARSIKKQLTDEKLGITEEDKKIRDMNVQDGERAEYIFNKLQKLETKEEKAAYWEDMVKKKILTDDVKKQVKELLKKD